MNFYMCTAVCQGINPTLYTNHKNTVLAGAKGMTCNNLLPMLQVKIKFRLKFFQPRLVLYFLCLVALIIAVN